MVLEAIEQVNQELGTTTVIITHNAAIADMADRVIRMRSGEIIEVIRNGAKARPDELIWPCRDSGWPVGKGTGRGTPPPNELSDGVLVVPTE